MTRPVYELNEGRAISALGFGQRQLFRRPADDHRLPVAYLSTQHTDLSTPTFASAFNLGIGFDTTHPDEVFYWNEPTHDPGVFDEEGNGTNPFITTTLPGTYNISHYVVCEFAEELIVSASVPGEWILRSGFTDFNTVIVRDLHWSTNYRDLRLENADFIGSGAGADEPPWHFVMFNEVDHKIVTCEEASFASPFFMFPTIQAVPLLGAAFADAVNIILGDTFGLTIFQWMSGLTQDCGE